ncbi:MAG: tyrosine-protein phosphatase [Planctomycetota bacterium]|nr:tyrosine-protein phosphatase [Planctomycetota bacterium]
MKWTRGRSIAALVAVAASAAGGGAAYWWKDYPVHHFAVVKEGVLYRSGQPDPGQLRLLVSRYGIRTVVNLRGLRSDDPWWRAEAAFCGRQGLRVLNMEMGEAPLAEANIKEFLDIVRDPANRPVLVHCEAGSVRTGFAVAAYRIACEGWSYPKAMAEAAEFHLHLDKEAYREFEETLRGLTPAIGFVGQ